MRETIDVLYTYNLVDANGNKLQLNLGHIKGSEDFPGCVHVDKGYRWRFIGRKIPMPVRNRTWFNGFPVETMMDWLKANGWYLRSRVTVPSGEVNIFELPDMSQLPTKDDIPAYISVKGKQVLEDCIRHLCANGMKLDAICLYRYVNPCTLSEGKYAVDKIQFGET